MIHFSRKITFIPDLDFDPQSPKISYFTGWLSTCVKSKTILEKLIIFFEMVNKMAP